MSAIGDGGFPTTPEARRTKDLTVQGNWNSFTPATRMVCGACSYRCTLLAISNNSSAALTTIVRKIQLLFHWSSSPASDKFSSVASSCISSLGTLCIAHCWSFWRHCWISYSHLRLLKFLSSAVGVVGSSSSRSASGRRLRKPCILASLLWQKLLSCA